MTLLWLAISSTRLAPNILLVFYSAPNSEQNALLVFGRIVEPKISRIQIISTWVSAAINANEEAQSALNSLSKAPPCT